VVEPACGIGEKLGSRSFFSLSYVLFLTGVSMWALCFISKKKVTHIIRGMKIKNRDRNLKQKLYDPNDIIVINDQNQFYLKVTK
jgi:hypothetical protein